MTRKKLVKFLGKDLKYTATYQSSKGTKAVLVDVYHKGKYICDHVNVSLHYTLQKLTYGTELSFTAVAITYKDTFNIRKHGLSKCHNYLPKHEGHDIVKHDNYQKRKRRK